MKKNNQFQLIITTIVCLLPLVLSLVLYSRLPEQIAVHWDSVGNPNGYLPKALAAFGLPVFLAVINVMLIFFVSNDPKKENTPRFVMGLLFWLIPVMSLILMPITLFISIGANIPITLIVPIFVGIVFIVLGNYMPKVKQNYTMGIRLPWTLSDTDNWNKTNRFAGYMFIISGIIIILSAFIITKHAIWYTISIVLLILVTTTLYSYLLYRKKQKDN